MIFAFVLKADPRMAENLELKVPLRSLSEAARICKRLGATDKGNLIQRDTYFDVPVGRLKVREIKGSPAELISYRRENRKGKRYSAYEVIPIRQAAPAIRGLRYLFKVRCVVEKVRRLYLLRNARIHLDSVKGLGSFLEFEVVVTNGKSQAQQLMAELCRAFGVDTRKTIAGSYEDLLARRKK
jgi:adenylate cyclase class IV